MRAPGTHATFGRRRLKLCACGSGQWLQIWTNVHQASANRPDLERKSQDDSPAPHRNSCGWSMTLHSGPWKQSQENESEVAKTAKHIALHADARRCRCSREQVHLHV